MKKLVSKCILIICLMMNCISLQVFASENEGLEVSENTNHSYTVIFYGDENTEDVIFETHDESKTIAIKTDTECGENFLFKSNIDMNSLNLENGRFITTAQVIKKDGTKENITSDVVELIRTNNHIDNIFVSLQNSELVLSADLFSDYEIEDVKAILQKSGNEKEINLKTYLDDSNMINVSLIDDFSEFVDSQVKIEFINQIGEECSSETIQVSSIEQFDTLTVEKSITPNINNVKVQNNGTNYTITAEIVGTNIKQVIFPTWTLNNGQDDISWQEGNLVGNLAAFTVDMKDHKYEDGEYITHIYAIDKNGQQSYQPVPVQVLKKTKPIIQNIKVQNDGTNYTITANITGMNIKQVVFPTWTTRNGQDDISWQEGKINGNKVTFTVNMKDHNYEEGEYNTHIYAIDALGQQSYSIVSSQVLKKKAPTIDNIKVQNDGTSYTITADVTGMNIKQVVFPTWTTRNGQDDISWQEGKIVENKATFTVNMKDHKYEDGEYVTHIYAIDVIGQQTSKSVDTQILKKVIPSISNVHVVNSGTSYTITADVNGLDIKQVIFPTWTAKNGQDDISWQEGKIAGNKVSFTVTMKDHKYEEGDYITHIYAIDTLGQQICYQVKSQTLEATNPSISNVQVSDISSQGYLVTCTINAELPITKVEFPTWTERNGQDDITWGKGTISGNKVSYRVYVKDHRYEFGNYVTHIYAYNDAGKKDGYPISAISVNPTSTPGWSIQNGEKNLYDANGKIVGTGTLVIDISQHNAVIDWNKVKNSGVDEVILRSSYGYNFDDNGNPIFNQMDKQFEYNVSELNRLGIPYGIYHFSYAKSTGEGALEAKYVLECIKKAGAKPSMPIFYDLEYSDYVGEKSNSFYTTISKEFANVIRSSGYQIGVYANNNWWMNKLTDSSFGSYIKWIAHYGTSNNNAAGTANPNWRPTNDYKLWQYSSQGKVSGITTNVDMNIMYK